MNIKSLFCNKKILLTILVLAVVIYTVFFENFNIQDSWILFFILACPLMHLFMHKGHNLKK